MVVDSDDLVSKKLAAFVEEEGPGTNWVMDTGYILYDDIGVLLKKSGNFHRRCGSTTIAWFEPDDLPRTVNDCDHDALFVNYFHSQWYDALQKRDGHVDFLPFRGTTYVIGTHVNLTHEYYGYKPSYLQCLKRFWQIRPRGKGWRQEFGALAD